MKAGIGAADESNRNMGEIHESNGRSMGEDDEVLVGYGRG